LDKCIVTGSLLESSLKLIGLIIVFILIIVACYYVTRFVGSRQLGKIKTSNFKPIDTYRLSQNQYLQIIKIGNRFILIAVNKDSVSKLMDLSEDEIILFDKTGTDTKSFHDIMSGMMKKKTDDESD
jgi:flagellar protein FliO/FliZ